MKTGQSLNVVATGTGKSIFWNKNMNERIKELANQADQYANQQNELYGVDFKTEYDQKFAELIVQECIDIVAGGGEFASRPKLVEKLQEHFGVRE
jgi:2,4-dienoyl-CoA reductase-like NADH-dependent reductase (Old Yellow Enzyme family)